MSDVNWLQLRTDYESGAKSLRQLARDHDVSKTYIIERRNKEQWNRPTTDRPLTNRPHSPASAKVTPLPIPDDAISIARIGLHQLAQHLQADHLLEIRDHKSLSDALAQYVKVLVTAPQETEATDGLVIPLHKISARTRMEIRRLLAEDEQQRQEGTG